MCCLYRKPTLNIKLQRKKGCDVKRHMRQAIILRKLEWLYLYQMKWISRLWVLTHRKEKLCFLKVAKNEDLSFLIEMAHKHSQWKMPESGTYITVKEQIVGHKEKILKYYTEKKSNYMQSIINLFFKRFYLFYF